MIRSSMMLSLKKVGLQVISGGGRTFSQQKKKIIPRLPVAASEKLNKRTRLKKQREEDEEYEREVRKEASEIYANFGEIPDPDFNQVKQATYEALQERERLDVKMRREKIFRQNFKSLVQKELNLLTYAEKEKIKFLHEQSPDEWTPEAISQSFPISPEGAFKVIKSTFKARSLKEIQNHDQRVSETIENVKSGEIPSTPELEERMKLRQQRPFVPGLVGPKSTKLLAEAQAPVVLGEFARLVAPPELLQAAAASASSLEVARVPVVPTIVDDASGPQDGDSYMLKSPSEAARELRQLNINPKKKMTLKEFRSNLKDVNQPNSTELMTASDISNVDNLANQSLEVKYIKKYSSPGENPSMYSAPVDEPDVKYEDEDYLNYHSISKYKSNVKEQLEKQHVNVLKTSDLSHEESPNHFEMPDRPKVQDSWNPLNIEVPPEMRRPGALYKRGKSYYDENGVFLYKVV